MRNFFRNKYILALLIATVLLLTVAGFFGIRKTKAGFAEDLTGIIVTPIQKLFSTIGYAGTNFLGYFSDIDMLRNENQSLMSEKAELEQKIRDLQGFESENERLRRMLDLKETNPELDVESAEIIARNPDGWYNTFTIDKGTSNGLALNQAVITTDKYLVGQIYDIGTTWAKIITITDPESSVGSIISRSRDLGIVEGDAQLSGNGYCKMTYISKNTNLVSGDFIETSGMGGVYPKGILIGKVLEIRPETHSISEYAIVQPAAELDRITEVFVIKNEMVEIP